MTFVDRIARIHIELDGTAIWRNVEVPLTTSLKGLHEIVQAVMGFEGYHLFQFEVADRRYGVPDPEWDAVLDARNLKLGVLVDRGVTAFTYTYDFGDNWQHTIAIQAISDADPALDYPRFLDGAYRAPPEDVGGIPGFEEFLDAMANSDHEEHVRMVQWYGRVFDSDDIDRHSIQDRMGKLARRRSLGKAGYAKSRRQVH